MLIRKADKRAINIYIFAVIFILFISSKAYAVYDKIGIDITPKDNEIQFCFNFDTKSYSQSEPKLLLDKSFLIAAARDGRGIFFISKGEEGLEVVPWQENVEPSPFLTWKKNTDSLLIEPPEPFCFPMFKSDDLKLFDLYCAVGTSFLDAVENKRYIRFFDGQFPSLPQQKKEWSVMVYMVGSDLETPSNKDAKNASKDIVEMINGTKNTGDNFNLVLTTGGSQRYGWNTVKRSWINKGEQYVLDDLSYVSMTEPNTLESFVLWSVENFPADHYALILWDHGGGAMGFGRDLSSQGKGKMMTLVELDEAYKNIKQGLGKKLDVVVYDACLMASLEVLQTTSLVSDAMSASAENVPWHGIDYSYLMLSLGSKKINSGIDFGKLAKESYIQQSREHNEFDNNINGIPYKGITSSVFDLTQIYQFEQNMTQFASSFKTSIENNSYSSYEAAALGLINALGYPFKKAMQYRSLSDSHIPIDFGGFLNSLKLRLPILTNEVEQVQNVMAKLVVDYEGNVAKIDKDNEQYNGRLSIDIGENKAYLQVLPQYFTQISDAVTSYKKRKEEDTFKPNSKLVCEQGVVCADFPNWLELYSEDILGLTIYTGWLESDSFQISKIEPIIPDKNTPSDITIEFSSDDICAYKLCVNSSDCNFITIKDTKGFLTAEAVINGINNILTFCPKNENEWDLCSVVETSGDNWGREESLYSEDSIKTVTMKKISEKTETFESSLSLVVGSPDEVVLKKDCSIFGKKIVVGFYGINQKSDEAGLCEEDECKNAGIIIRQ